MKRSSSGNSELQRSRTSDSLLARSCTSDSQMTDASDDITEVRLESQDSQTSWTDDLDLQHPDIEAKSSIVAKCL